MVLQRWQTVFLFMAFVLTAVFCLLPVGSVDDTVRHALDFPGILILAALSAVILLIDIFLYKDLRLQIKVAAIAMVLEAVAAALVVFLPYIAVGFECSLVGVSLVVAAFVLTWIGRNFMIKDRKLLAAADRLR